MTFAGQVVTLVGMLANGHHVLGYTPAFPATFYRMQTLNVYRPCHDRRNLLLLCYAHVYSVAIIVDAIDWVHMLHPVHCFLRNMLIYPSVPQQLHVGC